MSFSQHALLWLHIAAAIFTIGPVTAAIMSAPRHIRKRNAVVVGHLYRTTQIYTAASLLVLIFGLVLAGMRNDFAKWWISVSITLYVVAVVLLVLIMRDQRKAAAALRAEESEALAATAGSGEPPAAPGADAGAADGGQPAPAPAPAQAARAAVVERARIASMSGVVGIIWLVILVLMVWK